MGHYVDDMILGGDAAENTGNSFAATANFFPFGLQTLTDRPWCAVILKNGTYTYILEWHQTAGAPYKQVLCFGHLKQGIQN